jgi:ribosome maturation protein Sdo1
MCYHYIRECVDEGRIIIDYTTTEEQLANILIKTLGRVHFLELRDKIGIKFVGDRGQD